METRYTLLAQSKDYNNREPELSQQNTEIISKPWRRWAYGYPGNSQPAVPPNLNLLGALINLPGLLMIGVNLGALLYLLLGILGLTPPRSWPASHPHDFYRNNRHIVDDDGVDGGKETSVYF
ncbi:uncharacterized protein LOC115622916 [Scaptodrosophila lebanonensis]|uniref:Uncharacterized protein LOC115622916 n=1 Tax=Drosophila lebanonensis TaxID=7225 RepID=A0A6J2TBY7_DROLE|nr:uncharacterized protein LOC115622916 [Scaptodrosophila lebanonensis]